MSADPRKSSVKTQSYCSGCHSPTIYFHQRKRNSAFRKCRENVGRVRAAQNHPCRAARLGQNLGKDDAVRRRTQIRTEGYKLKSPVLARAESLCPKQDFRLKFIDRVAIAKDESDGPAAGSGREVDAEIIRCYEDGCLADGAIFWLPCATRETVLPRLNFARRPMSVYFLGSPGDRRVMAALQFANCATVGSNS